VTVIYDSVTDTPVWSHGMDGTNLRNRVLVREPGRRRTRSLSFFSEHWDVSVSQARETRRVGVMNPVGVEGHGSTQA